MAKPLEIFTPMIQGFSEQRAANFEAKQLNAAAKATEAQGTRAARDIRTQTQGILGDMAAAQAGQGGVSNDPSAIRQQARMEQRGKYNELSALFQSKEEARGRRLQAKSARLSGRIARNQGILGSVSTAADMTSNFTDFSGLMG